MVVSSKNTLEKIEAKDALPILHQLLKDDPELGSGRTFGHFKCPNVRPDPISFFQRSGALGPR